MAFEIYKKRSRAGANLMIDEVSVGKTSISFLKGLFDEDVEYLEIYLNREDNQVGLKPTSNQLSGFKITNKNKSQWSNLVTGAFVKEFAQGVYDIEIEDDMVVFNPIFKKTE